MNNKRCPNCGFINFVTAENCHKCAADLNAPVGSESDPFGQFSPAGPNQGSYQMRPAKSGGFPIVKVVLGLFGGMVLLAVGAGVLASMVPHGSSDKISWREFRSPHAGITVMMPAEPKENEPVVTPLPQGNMTNHGYSSMVMGQGSALYCVVSFPGQLPTDRMAVEKLLEGELNNSLKVTHATLVTEKYFDFNGNPGLEFEVKPPALSDIKSPHGFGKIFIMNNQEYFMMVTASEGSDLLRDKDMFLNPTAN